MAKRKKKTTPTPESDPWFNPYRHAATHRGAIALGDLIHLLEQREARKRARRKQGREWLWKVGYALLADLTHHYLGGSPGNGLVVPRAKRELGKKSRYDPGFFTQSFPKLLDEFERQGLLKQTKGKFSGWGSKRTTIRPGVALIEVIKKERITFEDLSLQEAEEVIILKRAKLGYGDEGGRIEYKDTRTTVALRTAVQELNVWLDKADIKFDASKYDRPVDTRARRFYRYFAEAKFDRGGRLFKGFWENLPKRARLS